MPPPPWNIDCRDWRPDGPSPPHPPIITNYKSCRRYRWTGHPGVSAVRQGCRHRWQPFGGSKRPPYAQQISAGNNLRGRYRSTVGRGLAPAVSAPSIIVYLPPPPGAFPRSPPPTAGKTRQFTENLQNSTGGNIVFAPGFQYNEIKLVTIPAITVGAKPPLPKGGWAGASQTGGIYCRPLPPNSCG